jgi:hypothetical protein
MCIQNIALGTFRKVSGEEIEKGLHLDIEGLRKFQCQNWRLIGLHRLTFFWPGRAGSSAVLTRLLNSLRIAFAATPVFVELSDHIK